MHDTSNFLQKICQLSFLIYLCHWLCFIGPSHLITWVFLRCIRENMITWGVCLTLNVIEYSLHITRCHKIMQPYETSKPHSFSQNACDVVPFNTSQELCARFGLFCVMFWLRTYQFYPSGPKITSLVMITHIPLCTIFPANTKCNNYVFAGLLLPDLYRCQK